MYHWNLLALQVAEQREINLIRKSRDWKDKIRSLEVHGREGEQASVAFIQWHIKVSRASALLKGSCAATVSSAFPSEQ